MPITRACDADTWQLPGTTFTTVASPTRGESPDVSVWRLRLEPHTPPTPHSVTRTEVFAVLDGSARVRIDREPETTVGPGDALIVPPDTEFELSTGAEPLDAVVCLPVGGQAAMPGVPPFTPQWAR